MSKISTHEGAYDEEDDTTTDSDTVVNDEKQPTNNDIDDGTLEESEKQPTKREDDEGEDDDEEKDNGNNRDTKIHITHVFVPFTMNPEFSAVSQSWKAAAEYAASEAGIKVEFLATVLPEDEKFVPLDFAKPVILEKWVKNYRKKGKRLPIYGDVFEAAKRRGRGELVLYSNVDIGVTREFYVKVWRIAHEDLRSREKQAEAVRATKHRFYKTCIKETKQYLLCFRDALIFFEDQGGIPISHLTTPPREDGETGTLDDALLKVKRYVTALGKEGEEEEALMEAALDALEALPRTTIPVPHVGMTITRLQLVKTKPEEVLNPKTKQLDQKELMKRYKSDGESHPGNDVFIMPRLAIPNLLLRTHFTHLRPSGMLIGQAIRKAPHLAWRRILSSPEDPFTFHLGDGTDEWDQRADVDPRAVLFEVAEYFTALNLTRTQFFPPKYCDDISLFRESAFCEKNAKLGFCRGYVRLACTPFYQEHSREAIKYRYLCYKLRNLGTGKNSVEPFCSFCNALIYQDKRSCAGAARRPHAAGGSSEDK